MNEDISERAQDEGLLSSAGLLCCSLLNATQIVPGRVNPVSIGFALVDHQGKYVRVNDALAVIDGMPAEAHAGKTIREVIGEAADKVEAAIERVVSTGEYVTNLEISATLPNRYEPGYWVAHFFPFKFKKHEPNYIACMIVETTGLLKIAKCFGSLIEFLPRIADQFLLAGSPNPSTPEKLNTWNEALFSLRQCKSALLRVAQYFPKPPELEDVRNLEHPDSFGTPSRLQPVLNFPPKPKDEDDLSPREIEVVKFLANGKGTKEIAEALELTVHTIDTYRGRILNKLGVHTTAEVVKHAIKHRLIEI